MSGGDDLDVTKRFLLEFSRAHGGSVLDFGCGAGALISAGLRDGLDFRGTDLFYGGSISDRGIVAAQGFMGDRVRPIIDGRIPFADATFDLIIHSLVMEHVEDLDATLAEIARVLKSGGTLLSLFPSREVWREGHIGIPFAHRLPVGSALRLRYTQGMRTVGFGTFKSDSDDAREWALDKLEWIDTWTRYRTREQIFAAYARSFRSELRERDYIRFRLLDRPSRGRRLVARTVNVPVISRLEEAVFRKLAFLVIVSKKE